MSRKVSIVIPMFNRETFLKNALQARHLRDYRIVSIPYCFNLAQD